MFKHILIPIDGSELSLTALDKGLAFARETGAMVSVLTVVEPLYVFPTEAGVISLDLPDYEKQAAQQATKLLALAQERASQAGVASSAIQVSSDHPYQAIIDTAIKGGCDLIAIASHGRRGLEAVILGSQTMKVLTHSTIPVLVYR